MKLKFLTGAGFAYLLVCIVTFGNAAVFFEKRGEANRVECEARTEEKLRTLCSWKESDGIAAAFSAIAWPFYWSYRLAQ